MSGSCQWFPINRQHNLAPRAWHQRVPLPSHGRLKGSPLFYSHYSPITKQSRCVPPANSQTLTPTTKTVGEPVPFLAFYFPNDPFCFSKAQAVLPAAPIAVDR
jgi:hypothetical protein